MTDSRSSNSGSCSRSLASAGGRSAPRMKSMDMYQMREPLAKAGLRYID
jgi:hypothetical protein